MAAYPELESRVAKAWPPEQWRDVHVLVAVSGGADSVALLRILAGIKERAAGSGQLLVAHYDHQMRGEASKSDADWVERLAVGLGLECHRGISSHSGSRNEAQLREERHEFLARTASEVGARYIATGHTADDQAETVLFRLLRGSGLAGLRGIAAARPLAGGATTLVRPLIGVTRKELMAYHEQWGSTFREDNTNASIEPTRNWIRHALLPGAEERFGAGVPDALARLAGQAREAQAVIDGLADELLERAAPQACSVEQGIGTATKGIYPSPSPSPKKGRGISFDCPTLAAATPLIAREAIRLAWRRAGWPEQAMTAGHWGAILELSARKLSDRDASTGAAMVLPGEIDCRRDGQRLVLQRKK